MEHLNEYLNSTITLVLALMGFFGWVMNWMIGAKVNPLKDQITKLEKDVDRKFEDVDRRFGEVDRKFDEVNRRFDRLEAKIDQLLGWKAEDEKVKGKNQL